MAVNPLRAAQRDALKLSRWIEWAMGRYLGSQQHPRGQVLNIYRKARRDMSGVLKAKRRSMKAEASAILADTRRKLTTVVNASVLDAVGQGRGSALVQLAAYADDGVRYIPQMLPASVEEIAQAPIMEFNRQALQILGLISGGGDVLTTIVGDAGRVGVFQPSPIITVAADSITKSVSNSFVNTVGREPAQAFEWMKQPIPAIDDRTTETCLNVAGQVVGVDELFHLTGTPRFADDMDWSPFHYYCRTSITLYLERYDDGITAELREDVRAENERRAAEEAAKGER